MFNREKLDLIINEYKQRFPEHWKDEMYKWEAIKHFQDNWNINADDFLEMFMATTEKTGNLLASMNNFPRGMIKEYASVDPERVRGMFIDLYDESQNLTDRIEQFKISSDGMREKYGDDIWKNHYQNDNAITTYLWLRYPDKYYIYKYSEVKAFANAVDSDFVPKKGGATYNVERAIKLYVEIRNVIMQDSELDKMLKNALTDSCYPDPEKVTMTIDVGFFVSRYYGKSNTSRHELKTALEQKDLSDSLLYAKGKDIHDDSNINYWWLNANPRIWSFSDVEVGEEQAYTLYNDNGNKRRIFQNFLDAKAGDMVIGYESNPVKQVVALAQVVRENDGENLYFKKIEEFVEPIDYTTLKDCTELSEMECFVNPQGSLFKLTRAEYDFIMDVVREYNGTAVSKETIETYGKEDFLNEVYMTEEKYDTLVALLKNKKNLILHGAPGVGKTFAAKRLAYSIMGEQDESRIEFIQFHQNYSYEDFIMGYKPQEEGYKLCNGIFYQFCMNAANHPDKDYFFIIDEINRGNMSKIFGELLMLIEKDYRGTKTTMAYSGTSFSVPKNLYIIGMMNTADRSLAMIDYALRRRFSFFEMEPGFNSDGFKKYQNALDNETFNALVEQVIELNREIKNDDSLGDGFRIGHSYFCGQDECTEEWMKSVVYYDIIPMLHEYWFDDKKKVQQWENKLSGVFND